MRKYICSFAHKCDERECPHIEPHMWLGPGCTRGYCKHIGDWISCGKFDPIGDMFDEVIENL